MVHANLTPLTLSQPRCSPTHDEYLHKLKLVLERRTVTLAADAAAGVQVNLWPNRCMLAGGGWVSRRLLQSDTDADQVVLRRQPVDQANRP